MSAAPELEFNAENWNDMPPAERVRRCMLFAHEANQHALDAAPDVSTACRAGRCNVAESRQEQDREDDYRKQHDVVHSCFETKCSASRFGKRL